MFEIYCRLFPGKVVVIYTHASIQENGRFTKVGIAEMRTAHVEEVVSGVLSIIPLKEN